MIQSIKDNVGDFDAEALQEVLRKELYGVLPAAQKKRIRATRYLEKQCREIDNELEKKIFELTETYQPRYAALRAKRMAVVTGAHEPTEEEAPEDEMLNEDDDSEDGAVEEINEDEEKEDKAGENAEGAAEGDAAGIPGFWLQVLEHASIDFEDHDAESLHALVDIRYNNVDMRTFQLIFEFAENDFFTNKTLTLTYTPPDEEAGDEVGALSGTEIEWKEGKKLTATTVTKKQRSVRTQKTRTVTKEMPIKSFFGLFELNLKQTDLELWDEIEQHMYPVSEIVHKMRYQVIPDATAFYLDLVSDDEDDDEDDDEYDEDDDEDTDDDEEEDVGVLGMGTGEKAVSGANASGQPGECNQQ